MKNLAKYFARVGILSLVFSFIATMLGNMDAATYFLLLSIASSLVAMNSDKIA